MDSQAELWLAYIKEIKFSLELVTFNLTRKKVEKKKNPRNQTLAPEFRLLNKPPPTKL